MFKSTNSRIFVLLHGAWHGSWCWKRIIPLLRVQGHTVITPDLPGHGLDKTPLANVTLKTYVDEVVRLVSSYDRPVTLVGHSMSGVVISQVGEYIPDKIEQLIYLAAFVPSHGGSLVQETAQMKSNELGREIVIDPEKNEIALKLSSRIRDFFYNTCSDQEAALALSQLQKQPFRPFIDLVELTQSRFGKLSKLYIECLQDEAIKIADQRRMYAKIKCDVASLNSDHSPFICQPLALSNIILHGCPFDEREEKENVLCHHPKFGS